MVKQRFGELLHIAFQQELWAIPASVLKRSHIEVSMQELGLLAKGGRAHRVRASRVPA